MSRELDFEVATKVLGKAIGKAGHIWEEGTDSFSGETYLCCIRCGAWAEFGKGRKEVCEPIINAYSKDMNAAWEVVELMVSKGYRWRLHADPTIGPAERYACHFNQAGEYWSARADSAPEAICKTALLVMDDLAKWEAENA